MGKKKTFPPGQNPASAKKIDIEYVAHLARLTLDINEIATFSSQLDTILEYINKLNEVDTRNVLPTSHVLPLKNVFREDVIKPSLTPEEALKNAPARQGDFFKVPRIIED